MKSKQRKSLFWTLVIACSIGLIGFGTGSALAQGDVDRDGNPMVAEEQLEELGGGYVTTEEGEYDVELDESFGRNTQATWVGAHEFDPYTSNEAWSSVSATDPHRFGSVGGGIFCAQVRIPSGARITAVAYFYYDVNVGSNVRLQFWRANSQTSHSPLFNFLTPGAVNGYATTTWFPSFTVQNGGGWYYACFDVATGGGAAQQLWGVRILWNRQLRTGLPNPFVDIGSLPAEFRNSITALVASGITTGTSPNTYSPNNPVTRAQMAVFLARALGLYWAYPTY